MNITTLPNKETEEEWDAYKSSVPLVHLEVDHGHPQVQEDHTITEGRQGDGEINLRMVVKLKNKNYGKKTRL